MIHALHRVTITSRCAAAGVTLLPHVASMPPEEQEKILDEQLAAVREEMLAGIRKVAEG